MALCFVLVFAAFGALVNGVAYNPPRSTSLVEGQDFDWRGWTPAPTTAPQNPHELLRRGLLELEGRDVGTTVLVAEDQTCGYLSGSAGAPYECLGTRTCNFFPAAKAGGLGAVACCDQSDCFAKLFCVNSREYWSSSACDDVCEANIYMLKCTELAEPYCNTVFFADVSAQGVYCFSKNVSTIQTMLTHYQGQTFGGSFSEQVLTDVFISTSSTIRTTSSTIPAPVPTTSVPPPDNPTPIGPIVGGTIGGVAVLGLIGLGVFFILHRKRKNTTDHLQPPTYGNIKMDDHGGAMQMSQQKYNSHQPQPVPMEGYYSQQNLGPAPKPVEPVVDRTKTTSPVSPELGRESYASAPAYDSSIPQNVHEVSGRPVGPASG